MHDIACGHMMNNEKVKEVFEKLDLQACNYNSNISVNGGNINDSNNNGGGNNSSSDQQYFFGS